VLIGTSYLVVRGPAPRRAVLGPIAPRVAPYSCYQSQLTQGRFPRPGRLGIIRACAVSHVPGGPVGSRFSPHRLPTREDHSPRMSEVVFPAGRPPNEFGVSIVERLSVLGGDLYRSVRWKIQSADYGRSSCGAPTEVRTISGRSASPVRRNSLP